MRKIGKNARGVAVVKPGVADAELERLTWAGACALRIPGSSSSTIPASSWSPWPSMRRNTLGVELAAPFGAQAGAAG
jgi:hypothetical protein